MGITKRGGHCLTGIYLDVSGFKVKIFIKYSIPVLNKLIETKNYSESYLQASKGHKTSANLSVRHCFQKFTYWLEWYLVIPRESTGEPVGYERTSKQLKSIRKNFNSNARLVQDKS